MIRALFALLLLCGPLWAADLPIALEKEYRVNAGYILKVTPKTPGKKVKWKIAGPDPMPSFLQEGATIYFASPVSGSFFITAFTSVNDSPEWAEAVIVNSPPPPPPEPPDSLLAPVQAAYSAADASTRAADVKSLAAVYRATAGRLADVTTAGGLFQVIKGASDTVIDGRLKPIRAILGAELGKVMPADPDAALTADLKAKASGLLIRFASLLEVLK